MSTIKSNGTKIYALISGEIVRFRCYNAVDLGQDSFGKIDISCLDSESKKYRRGAQDPGEGSLTIQIDDENTSHADLLLLVESGDEVEWFIGSSGEGVQEEPTVTGGIVTLPTSRNWLTFDGYLNGAAPSIEMDSVWTYAYPLVRTSPVATILRTV